MAIEERLSGRYAPSPGVINPTLAGLEDRCDAMPHAWEPGRKCYRITVEGKSLRGPVDPKSTEAIASALDAVATLVEKIR